MSLGRRLVSFFILLLLAPTLVRAVKSDDTSPPGGDVLSPFSMSYPAWRFGMDAGVQYASYSGKFVYSLFPSSIAPIPVFHWAPFESGDGLGFQIHGVVDVSLNERMGIVAKLGYVGRTDKFTSTHINPIFYTGPDGFPAGASLDNKLDWSLEFFDAALLFRYQIVPESWYVLGGFSYSNIVANTADFTQRVLAPEGVSYPRADGSFSGITEIENSGEVRIPKNERVGIRIGGGIWIPLSNRVAFTPELLFDLPLTEFLTADSIPFLFVPDSDANYWAVSLTAGIRFGL